MSVPVTNNLSINQATLITNSSTSSSNLALNTDNQTFNQFFQQFLVAMQQQQVWSTLNATGVGTTLLGNFATLGTACEFYTQRRLQEAFIDTAQSALSVYEIVNLLGGTILGNSPSFCLVSYTNTYTSGSFTIEAYSIFSVNGGTFYNAEAISINPQVGTTPGTGVFVLVEGEPVTIESTSTGNANQVFYLSSNYMSSASATTVNIINGNQITPWTRVESLWLDGFIYEVNPISKTTVSTPLPVYQSKLYSNGQVQVVLGDGIRGQIPPVGTTIQITAFNASGGLYKGSTSPSSPFVVSLVEASGSNASTIQSIFTTYVTASTTEVQGGELQPNVNIYKTIAPAKFADSGRFVSNQDYEAGVLTFNYNNTRPILACSVLGEKNINPGNAALANTINIILITYTDLLESTTFTSALSDYLGAYGVFGIINIIPATYVEFDELKITVTRENLSLTVDQIVTTVQQALIDLIGVYRDTTYVSSGGSTVAADYNISNARSNLIGATWYVSTFYTALTNVLGVNKVLIQYNINGVTNNQTEFVLNYSEYLALTLDKIQITVVDAF